jgi:S1-C subfamily serine protease
MRLSIVMVFLFASAIQSYGQNAPVTQKEACAKFSDAIVKIDAGGQSFGSGFIVSPDGYILTANHVIRSAEGPYYSAIFVTLAGNKIEPATPVLPLSPKMIGQDYALLKITARHPLPFLQLGNAEDVVIGGDATIVGFPFSAVSPNGRNVAIRFCFSAIFAASDTVTISFDGKQKSSTGIVPIHQEIKADVIYFQAPSVKGISGSPIISRDTGQVVGIVSTKLTGISISLGNIRNEAVQSAKSGSSVHISGVDAMQFMAETVNVLDSQLANGLGSAVGIDDPKSTLKQIQRKK